MQAFSEKQTNDEIPLQLLLFIDKRPRSRERIRQIRDALKDFRAVYTFALEVIDVSEQPYLAEHFRLVATPALIKLHPEPRQMLAGTDLVAQLKHWWPYWQRSVETYMVNTSYQQALNENLDVVKAATIADRSAAVLTNASDTTTVMGTHANALSSALGTIAHSAELLQLTDEVFRLKQEKAELEHQLRFKDEIISMLAHDLRNPLTAASIAIETLEMGHSVTEGWSSRLTPTLTAQLLKHARTQTRAIDHMITDILQAARGTSGELRIVPQKLDLGALCVEVVEYLQDRFQAKAQRVTHDIPSDLPGVYADSERVRQVLVNLLDNAVKYTPTGGSIAVSILHRTTQKVQVSVGDNGPGIPEENRDRIFEDHFRLERDAAKDGYGIGLSLCQRIIRAHYGQIWVDSTPNTGSCFHFTLPVCRM
ncbi:histidine kinase [Stenomitos frigidus]|uniref:Adaptive-response sensory-kinase SasA n=1 Tax=Stenomitos frigidus ULC18 TaxID=2107698 RepID=A0A2T1E1B8_9CYAN|nr:histidine kinase [Stenomitos frigidus]PSB26548.1 histidine kinase [Stenomitos frigidus ULC18]